ncbi:MAG: alpha/beta hydrolase, partial [Bacteroidota bacterium]
YDMIGWAKLLARSGIAALVWDGRGAGRSSGDAATVTAESREAEVQAALDLMSTCRDLGPVGLLSYSAGGWITPDVAAERDDVAFVVALVGPAQSLADQQGHVTTAFMRASGESFTEAEYAEAFAYQRATVELAQTGRTWSAFEQINAPAREARWAAHALIPDSPDLEDLDYFRRRIGFDAPAWDRVRVPVLAVYGEADLIVPPQNNVPRLRAALAGNADATVLVIPGADHTLARPAGLAGEGEWPHRFYRPWTRSPAVLEGLVEWLRERFVSGD